ncbi:hypothetical protein Ciccas_012585 [Cichlidogyrus casuarinus]|uniref:Uncharacterized protein n=1 Tax=Cichlidogyrus casuarinus TaxID=1844966 RepID=A0ABD2PQZ6_9PLAT
MNPFGDDDEDFRTSEMLDYNLDLSVRCAGARPEMYPEDLASVVVPRRRILLTAGEKEQDNKKDTKSDINFIDQLSVTSQDKFDFNK